jgi:hypothetical protein
MRQAGGRVNREQARALSVPRAVIRRFLHWLLDVDAKVEAALAFERAQYAFAVKLREQASYLKGHEDGKQSAFDAMAAELVDRRAGDEGHSRQSGSNGGLASARCQISRR